MRVSIGGLTETLQVGSGIRQVCLASGALLAILFDPVVRRWLMLGVGYAGAFADDVGVASGDVASSAVVT